MRPGRSVAGRSWDRRISLAPAACPAAAFGNATILLYLAVTFAVQRMVVITRSQRMTISGQNEATGLT
jgi:hypothetical protein